VQRARAAHGLAALAQPRAGQLGQRDKVYSVEQFFGVDHAGAPL
jgi:hypothetical protein